MNQIIIVQDAARPNATLELYQKGIESLDIYDAVVPGIKPTDTVKIIDNNNIVIQTINRESIMNIQTPQFFDRKVLINNINLNKDLVNLTGGYTVPQIIIDDKVIGGFDQLLRLNHEGKLKK